LARAGTKLKEQAEYLSRQYHCVVTNPPYMGSKGMNSELRQFVESKFIKSKSDLMATFIERGLAFTLENGRFALINQHSWMFLSTYLELRPLLIDNFQIESMFHLGPRTFPEIGGEVVQNTTLVFGKYKPIHKGIYVRLTDYENTHVKEKKAIEAINKPSCEWLYISNQLNFDKIPNTPIAYWVRAELFSVFENEKLHKYATPRAGMITGNNEKFVRFWWEVSQSMLMTDAKSRTDANNSNKIWFPYQKGGSFRKWFGNKDYVVNWQNDGNLLRTTKNENGKVPAHAFNEEYIFRANVNWSAVASGNFSARITKFGSLFDAGGSSAFPENSDHVYPIAAYLNSTLVRELLQIINPTLNFQAWEIGNLPFKAELFENAELIRNVEKAYQLEEYDWNTSELSWSFNSIDYLNINLEIRIAYNKHIEKFIQISNQLLETEKEINNSILNLFEIRDGKNVELEELTLIRNYNKTVNSVDTLNIVFSQLSQEFLSYSIGCIFGRYSLDKPALILANQGETLQDFLKQVPHPTFMPDEDNIIPVLDGEWFTDDIVGRFKVFLKAAFGKEHFEENLKYIEETINKDIRKYFVKDFYNDHIKRYKKRPIYWMFSSPKGHFKALIYMHRYQPDLCSKMLNDYLQAFISKLEAAKQTQTMLSLREDISAREKTIAIKEIDKYEAMLKDCREYEKTLFTIATQKISIDLDDGVKVNYRNSKRC
jgi:hypothetical protein